MAVCCICCVLRSRYGPSSWCLACATCTMTATASKALSLLAWNVDFVLFDVLVCFFTARQTNPQRRCQQDGNQLYFQCLDSLSRQGSNTWLLGRLECILQSLCDCHSVSSDPSACYDCSLASCAWCAAVPRSLENSCLDQWLVGLYQTWGVRTTSRRSLPRSSGIPREQEF